MNRQLLQRKWVRDDQQTRMEPISCPQSNDEQDENAVNIDIHSNISNALHVDSSVNVLKEGRV